MTTPLLSIAGLDASYGQSRILFGVGFEIEAGQTLALLGRNGAGKSTVMKTVAGVLAATAGSIRLRGAELTGLPAHRRARLGIGYVPEDRQVFPAHSVTDNLLIAAKTGPDGQDGWTLGRIWEQFPLLAGLRARPAGLLSGGEQQLLAIARTLMGNPVLLLLDEPSEGLAPVIVHGIAELLRGLHGSGISILLAEQNMHFCLGVASHAVVIDKGAIVHRADAADLRADAEVRRRYLAM